MSEQTWNTFKKILKLKHVRGKYEAAVIFINSKLKEPVIEKVAIERCESSIQ